MIELFVIARPVMVIVIFIIIMLIPLIGRKSRKNH